MSMKHCTRISLFTLDRSQRRGNSVFLPVCHISNCFTNVTEFCRYKQNRVFLCE